MFFVRATPLAIIAATPLWTEPPRCRAGVVCALEAWGLVYIFTPY